MTCIVSYKFITYILSKNKIQKIVYSKQVPEYLSIDSGMKKKPHQSLWYSVYIGTPQPQPDTILISHVIRLTTIQCIYFFSKGYSKMCNYISYAYCHRKDRFGNKINIHPSPLCYKHIITVASSLYTVNL